MNTPNKNDRATWICGPKSKCSLPPADRGHALRLVFIGAPGVGKSTIARKISTRLGLCHLSIEELVRSAVSKQTSTPKRAIDAAVKLWLDSESMPDSTLWEIVRERIGCLHCRGGFVLDGFPTSLSLANTFQSLLRDEGVSLDAALHFELPADQALARVAGRRICGKCHAIFHVGKCPPAVSGICNECGGTLSEHSDITADVFHRRWDSYQMEGKPIVDFYDHLSKLVTVSSVGTPDEVAARTLKVFEAALTDGVLRSRFPRETITSLGFHGDGPTSANDQL